MASKKKVVAVDPTPQINYVRKATVVSVADGDTVKVRLDLGFGISDTHVLRLGGINCGNTESKDPVIRERAIESKVWMQERLPVGSTCTTVTFKDKNEKFGRYLAVIWKDGVNLNEKLLELGLAVKYNGHGLRV